MYKALVFVLLMVTLTNANAIPLQEYEDDGRVAEKRDRSCPDTCTYVHEDCWWTNNPESDECKFSRKCGCE
ncbi:hypothetical protein AC249_AIPGENE6929 [Exaiptasia diaphana]|nr:hypothetical protein AC249_AIPGENE6929 [Exaiptasia diaphana]